MACILDDGDEIIVPEPFYPNYNTFIRLTGATVHPITTTPEAGYQFAVRERVEACINEHTRAILFTNPGNPTGTVLSREELKLMGRVQARAMQVVTFLGFVTLLLSLVLSVVALYQKIAGTALGGFTTVIIVQLFIGSVVMISLGIIGYYIAKIYEEVKGRPRFIVSATCGRGGQDAKITG